MWDCAEVKRGCADVAGRVPIQKVMIGGEPMKRRQNHRSVPSASVVIIGFFCVLSLMLWKDKTGADIPGQRLRSGSVLSGFYGSSALLCAQGRRIAGKS